MVLINKMSIAFKNNHGSYNFSHKSAGNSSKSDNGNYKDNEKMYIWLRNFWYKPQTSSLTVVCVRVVDIAIFYTLELCFTSQP